MVDVGRLPVKTGDEAVLIGRQGKEQITAEEIAGLCGTIPYEIVCGLGSRIPRVYL
jgi:alanine racemase